MGKRAVVAAAAGQHQLAVRQSLAAHKASQVVRVRQMLALVVVVRLVLAVIQELAAVLAVQGLV